MLRQPATHAHQDLRRTPLEGRAPAARFWFTIYAALALVALAGLVLNGFAYLLYLAVPGVPVFAWHLWLVSKREERRQINVEIIATGVLSLAAPAAYWVGIGRYEADGWWLWALVWIQTAASIVYAYLRLEQREQVRVPVGSALWRMGWRAVLYTSFNFVRS
jgi:hypothetical protein